MRTSWPFASSRSTVWEPMKPAPPVTRILILKICHHLRAVEIEAIVHLVEPLGGEGSANTRLAAVGAVEHEKSTTTGADDLPADRTGRPGELVPPVDAWVADQRGAALFRLPVLVQHQAKC